MRRKRELRRVSPETLSFFAWKGKSSCYDQNNLAAKGAPANGDDGLFKDMDHNGDNEISLEEFYETFERMHRGEL